MHENTPSTQFRWPLSLEHQARTAGQPTSTHPFASEPRILDAEEQACQELRKPRLKEHLGLDFISCRTFVGFRKRRSAMNALHDHGDDVPLFRRLEVLRASDVS